MVDVIIPFHNQFRLLARCLRSLELCTCAGLELVLVDDASTAAERESVRRLCGELGLPARLISHPENRGYKESVHTGLAACRNRHVILLNSDTILTPGFADRLVEVLAAGGEVRAVAPVSNNPTDLYQYREYLDLPAPAGGGGLFRAIGELSAQAGRQAAGRLTIAPYLTAMCLALDREVFDQVGYFGDRYRYGYFEDLALSCAIRELGFKLAVREDCFVYHEGHGTFRNKRRSERIEIIRHNFEVFSADWGHLPEHQDLLRQMEFAGRSCPV
jgi:GT2 family glycosyltransferase